MHNEAPYTDSALDGSDVERYANEDPDALFGQDTNSPQVVIIKEIPAHREMIKLRALGHSIREIAEVTEYTTVHVGNVLRQPWAKARMAQLLREADLSSLKEMIERAAAAAFIRQVERAEDESVPAAIRQRADESILDRYLGKKQTIEHSGKVNVNHLSDSELAALLPPTIATLTTPSPEPEPNPKPTTSVSRAP